MYFEDKNFSIYSNLYKKAKDLEKLKKEDGALKIYLNILNKYSPKGIDYYERPAIILERKKRYKEAVKICRIAISVPWKEYLNCKPDMFEHRLNRLNNKIIKQEENSNKITTVKKRTTNKPVKHSSATAITPIQAKEISTKNIKFPNWYVSISFGESRPPSFPQALVLAQSAPQYIENNVSGKILYQAVYSDKPTEYLQFIKLYELVSN